MKSPISTTSHLFFERKLVSRELINRLRLLLDSVKGEGYIIEYE